MTVALPVDGADLSHHNTNLNFALAKNSGLDWVSLKATQGDSFVDPLYSERIARGRSRGLVSGAYHFGETDSHPRAQCHHFLKYAGVLAGDFRPMLDVEDYADGGSFFSRMSIAQRTDWVGSFVLTLKAELGLKPFYYSPFDLEETLGLPLWVARYNPNNEMPRIPEPWSTFTIRQFTNGDIGVPNHFPGLGHVDLNCWNRNGGTPSEFLQVHTVPTATIKTSRGKRVDAALKELGEAKGKGERGQLLQDAIDALTGIKPIK